MGQILSGRAQKFGGAGCEAWPQLCSKENVSIFIEGVQGCLEAQRRTREHQGSYYDHIEGVSYLIHREIGTGEFSKVLEASRRTSSRRMERFAIKVYRSRNIERQKLMREEVRILQKLGGGCKEITRLHHHQETLDPETGTIEIKMVLDYCQGGTLRQLLKGVPCLEEHKTRIIAFQIVQALHHLHTRRIMHCDVKPENILFVEAGTLVIKLSDFGNAQSSPDGLTPPKSTSFNISDIYVAPEILKEASYGTPADMWAFGVTLYQCLTGQLPFQIGTTLTMEVIEEICSGSFIKRALSSEMFPENVSFNALLFLEKLLRVDPNERMNVVEALNHKWLRSTDLLDLTSNQLLREASNVAVGKPKPPMKMVERRKLCSQQLSSNFNHLEVDSSIGKSQQLVDINGRLASSHSTTASAPSFELLRTTSRSCLAPQQATHISRAVQAFNTSLQEFQTWDREGTMVCDATIGTRTIRQNRSPLLVSMSSHSPQTSSAKGYLREHCIPNNMKNKNQQQRSSSNGEHYPDLQQRTPSHHYRTLKKPQHQILGTPSKSVHASISVNDFSSPSDGSLVYPQQGTTSHLRVTQQRGSEPSNYHGQSRSESSIEWSETGTNRLDHSSSTADYNIGSDSGIDDHSIYDGTSDLRYSVNATLKNPPKRSPSRPRSLRSKKLSQHKMTKVL